MDPYTSRTVLKCYAGDFNGDGKDDLLVHNDNSIMVYRSNGSQLDLVVRGSSSQTITSTLVTSTVMEKKRLQFTIVSIGSLSIRAC